MLVIDHVCVDHGKLRALWDVSLNVQRGECVGLLGANGAGKSTTMGAIIGLYPIYSGSIEYDGRAFAQISNYESVSSGIALVPEGRQLFPQMSVKENLMMGAYSLANRNHCEEDMNNVFNLFPILKQKALQNAGELSGGQQQMVAIGRALMSQPKLLLLDEPFIGVAPKLVGEILDALKVIADKGVTMVLVEQNIHRALDFVERAYVIENGKTVMEGNKESLLGDSGFAAKFLGLQ